MSPMTVHPETGEVIETARVPSDLEQLPLFDGIRIPDAEVSFGGKVQLPLRNEDDRELLAALRLARSVTITLEVGDRVVQLDGAVASRSYATSEKGTVTKTKIVVDHHKHQ